MKKIEIFALINLFADHCKYGVDLDKLLKDIQKLQDKKLSEKEMNVLASKLKLHPILSQLTIHLSYVSEENKKDQKSRYEIVLDDEGQGVVEDNMIWVHTLVYDLISHLKYGVK